MIEAVYDDLGIRTWINAGGYLTRLGGALMAPEVVAAMRAASRRSVDMLELQAAASARIAPHAGTEAAIVTSGASSALTLAAAACLAGLDAARMDRLPHAGGMPNEVVMHRAHRSSYDHAIRAAGARIVDFGCDDRALDAGFRGFEEWEAEAAVTEATAAFAFAATPDNLGDLERLSKVASRARLPVIVDAAPWLPPIENLSRFAGAGGTLVAFSGGKAIGGPSGTGILCGPRDLIASALLQQTDMTIVPERWSPPTLIPREKLRGVPRHGIGRGMKVSKEEIVGLLVALDLFLATDPLRRAQEMEALLRRVRDGLAEAPGLQARLLTAHQTGRRPSLELRLDEKALGMSAVQAGAALRTLSPPVQMNERHAQAGVLIVDPACLREEDLPILVSSLREALRLAC